MSRQQVDHVAEMQPKMHGHGQCLDQLELRVSLKRATRAPHSIVGISVLI